MKKADVAGVEGVDNVIHLGWPTLINVDAKDVGFRVRSLDDT